jgi:hypothetical protein
MGEPRSILLLCDNSRRHAANVLQHSAALAGLSRHRVYPFNPIERPEACAALDLDEFDVVVIHFSIAIWHERYVPAPLAAKLAAFRGLTVQFIQDEYRSVEAVAAKMRELRVNVLFTCVPEAVVPEVYGPRLPGVHTVTTLPGYVPDELVGLDVPPVAARPIDVGYRARELPPWLGRLAQEKVDIARGFAERTAESELRCDVSAREEDRIYGAAWNEFMSSCRTTLGTESGSSIVDFDGTLEAQGKDYMARNPAATREEVERDLLGPYEGKVVINTASPRIFEAAALRTAMVLFRGTYSGVVEPGKHFILLEKDFSNLDEVVAQIRDASLLEGLVERSYDELIASGRYSLRSMVDEFDAIVSDRAAAQALPTKSRYRRARARRLVPSARRASRLRVALGAALAPVAGIVLITRDGALRRLALAGFRHKRVREAGLRNDLRRLCALRYGVRRGSFGVETDFDQHSGLLFISSRRHAPGSAPVPSRNATRMIEDLPVTEIVWNHSQLGISAGLAGGDLLAIRVGHHGVEGAYSFRALVELAHVEPGLVVDALAPVLTGLAGARCASVQIRA